jgi:hypothetical protein
MTTTATTFDIDNHAAVRQLREAQAQVEKIKNDDPQNFPEAASIGDAVRQGDVYIQLIEDVTSAPFLFKKATPAYPMQLAPGNTKGSRHCLEHGRGVTAYEPCEVGSAEMFNQLAAQYGIAANSPDLRQQLRKAEWAARKNGTNATKIDSIDALSLLLLAGPIFVLTETNTVTHPEHGDWVLPPGSYRVTYQRTVARDNTVTRVLD